MFTALTENNKRISIDEAIPGESYLCPVCSSPVVVKAASSVNIRTHFAHKKNTPCLDSWKHDMSDWHFDWQSKFPLHNREVIVEKDGIIHRADILINGTVIEFQHSPISSGEFEDRNSFYKNCGHQVVWLFDATDKMKVDDCFELVWKRRTTLFSNIRTPIDGLFIQNYLPEKKNLLCIAAPDPKEVRCHTTVLPIMPENFLKEFGAIQDDDILSIQAIFEETKKSVLERERELRKAAESQRIAVSNAVFNHLSGIRNRHPRRF